MAEIPRQVVTPATPIVSPDQEVHRPADDTEQIYYEGSPLLRAELGRGFLWVVVGIIAIAAPFLLWLFTNVRVPWWAYVAGIVVGVAFLSVPWLMAKSLRYRISNYRIDFEHGLLSKDIDTLELWHIEDIHFHQSIIDRILGVGTITVLSHDDTTPKLELRGIPHPRPLFDSLKQRVIAVKRQRGVIKMDTGT